MRALSIIMTARENGRKAIYRDDMDLRRFLDLLGREVDQQQWRLCVLMDNQDHPLLEPHGLGREQAKIRKLCKVKQ